MTLESGAGPSWRIDLGYDGSRFFGSQRQVGVRTVQGELEAALSRLAGMPVRVALAGRTDRGVHAVGQVASVRLRWNRPVSELRKALEALTPDDVTIYGVARVDEGFHARYRARRREYRYRIWQGLSPPLLLRQSVWHVRSGLDLALMDEAAAALTGRQDFASFAGSGRGTPGSGHNCVREISLARWRSPVQEIDPERQGTRLLEFQIQADGFLPQMVRNIVGNLVMIGRGDRPAEWLQTLLRAKDRRRGSAMAPAHGLVLWHVTYDEEDAGVDMWTGADDSRGAQGQ